MTDLPPFVHVWRCDGCGKVKGWKQRPPNHLRFFTDARDVPEAQRPYIVKLEPRWANDRDYAGERIPVIDEDTDQPVEVAWVLCGPFRKWTAQPAQDAPRPVPLPTRVLRPYDTPAPLSDDLVPF